MNIRCFFLLFFIMIEVDNVDIDSDEGGYIFRK
jgi:hypothetical protein